MGRSRGTKRQTSQQSSFGGKLGFAVRRRFLSRQTTLVERRMQMNAKRRQRCVVVVVRLRQHAFGVIAVTLTDGSRPRAHNVHSAQTGCFIRVIVTRNNTPTFFKRPLMKINRNWASRDMHAD